MNDCSYHCCQSDVINPLRVIILNLRPTTAQYKDIIAGLSELGHHVTNIHNIKRFLDEAPLHFSSLTSKNLPITQTYTRLSSFSIQKLLLRYHIYQKPTTGHACPSYGHFLKYYYHDPRCVICGENHFSDSCIKPRDSTASCALCNGSHTANYKGCSGYKKLKRFDSPVRRDPPILTHSPKSNTT